MTWNAFARRRIILDVPGNAIRIRVGSAATGAAGVPRTILHAMHADY